MTLTETGFATSVDVEEEALARITHQQLLSWVERLLLPREKRVIELHWGLGSTFASIGRYIDTSRARAGQIDQVAREKLQKGIPSQILKELKDTMRD